MQCSCLFQPCVYFSLRVDDSHLFVHARVALRLPRVALGTIDDLDHAGTRRHELVRACGRRQAHAPTELYYCHSIQR